MYDAPDAPNGTAAATATTTTNNVSQPPQEPDSTVSSTNIRPMSIPNNLHSTTTTTQQINGTSSLPQQQQQSNNNNGPVLSNGRTNNLLNNNQDLAYGTHGKGRTYYDSGDGTNSLSRLAPEGKDADLVKDEMRNNNNKIGAGKGDVEDSAVIPPTEVFSTSSNENGKINVQVTVLFGKLI